MKKKSGWYECFEQMDEFLEVEPGIEALVVHDWSYGDPKKLKLAEESLSKTTLRCCLCEKLDE